MKMKTLVIIGVDGSERREALPADSSKQLPQLQKAVGGYIEGIKVRYEGRVRRAYANEEGLLEGLPINRVASLISSEFGHQGIVGPIAIVLPYQPEGT